VSDKPKWHFSGTAPGIKIWTPQWHEMWGDPWKEPQNAVNTLNADESTQAEKLAELINKIAELKLKQPPPPSGLKKEVKLTADTGDDLPPRRRGVFELFEKMIELFLYYGKQEVGNNPEYNGPRCGEFFEIFDDLGRDNDGVQSGLTLFFERLANDPERLDRVVKTATGLEPGSKWLAGWPLFRLLTAFLNGSTDHNEYQAMVSSLRFRDRGPGPGPGRGKYNGIPWITLAEFIRDNRAEICSRFKTATDEPEEKPSVPQPEVQTIYPDETGEIDAVFYTLLDCVRTIQETGGEQGGVDFAMNLQKYIALQTEHIENAGAVRLPRGIANIPDAPQPGDVPPMIIDFIANAREMLDALEQGLDE
jgi:hypothetical protein